MIPLSLLNTLRQFTIFFEWTSQISRRLAFVQLLQDNRQFMISQEINSKIFKITPNELISLDSYLREYFEMMLVTLENLDVDAQNKQKDLII